MSLADWDAHTPTEHELVTLLRGFLFLKTGENLVSVVLWVNLFETGLVKKVLTELNFKHIQSLTWYKSGFNTVSGPACTFLPATEVAIIAFHGDIKMAVHSINMPSDPLQRHNIIIGPKMGKRAVDVDEKEINVCEKPAYLSEWILRKLTKPGDTVVVAGFGAGGDLRGALNAGCNVLGIEKCIRQFTAVKRMLPLFQPRSDMRMVVKPSMINFGFEWSVRLAPYCDNFADGTFTCSACEMDWPGHGFECASCTGQCCRECFPIDAEVCKSCALVKTGLEEVPENNESAPPAKPAETEERHE